MNIGFYNFYNVYNNNVMLTDSSSAIGDDLLYPIVYLGKYLKDHGHQAATIDTDRLEKFDKIVFLDYPTFYNPYFNKLVKMKHPGLYLYTLESEMLRPDNYNPENHIHFKKIFTWKTSLADNNKYILLNVPNKLIIDQSAFDLSIKKIFCTLIAGQKYHSGPLELYSERVRAIRWFEKNHASEFDLYGMGWDRLYLPGPLYPVNYGLSFLYKTLPFLPRFKLFPSYRGPLKAKKTVLKQYRFSISYENAVIPGYITEKIFDCLFSGCIPVYLGAPDAADFVPKDCFIDKRNFKTYEELYSYLKGMGPGEHRKYLDAIFKYITGPKIFPFTAEGFAQNICRELLK